ncbi:MAG: hypothetical protein Q6363_008455 [Candidatus Njordarchaeota archaeon]
MRHRIIVVECKPDKELALWVIRKINIRTKIIHRAHKGGKGMVLDFVRKISGVLAIIDEDPGTPRHPLYAELKPIYHSRYLNVYEYTKNNNIILELRPRLEGWLLAVMGEAKQRIMPIKDEDLLHLKLSAKPRQIIEILEKTRDKSRILENLINNVKEHICIRTEKI